MEMIVNHLLSFQQNPLRLNSKCSLTHGSFLAGPSLLFYRTLPTTLFSLLKYFLAFSPKKRQSEIPEEIIVGLSQQKQHLSTKTTTPTAIATGRRTWFHHPLNFGRETFVSSPIAKSPHKEAVKPFLIEFHSLDLLKKPPKNKK